VTLLQPTRSPS